MRFSNRDYAEFYDRQQRDAGYPGALLPPVISELDGFRRVIDIGAGTGFFAIPLAGAGHMVTAVEPSREMSLVMQGKCSPEVSGRISVVNEKWESWTGEFHDAAICVHSIYPMDDPVKGISLMLASAGKRIIIVRETSGMKSLPGTVRKILDIELNRDFNPLIVSALKGFRTEYRFINVTEERDQVINDIDEETGAILYQLKLDPSCRGRITEIVKGLCGRIEGSLVFRALYSDNIYVF